MSIFKCKMCGGDLEIAEGVTIVECEYCGTKQTVPKAMDENLQNLFNRANTLRIKSEFDKAEKIYEKIIQADSTQSDAYWGLILCKYGIEYVDDPATFKKVPTCHRASYDSIIADDDYRSAIENADISQRSIYEEQAKEIDRIQKEILALAQKEENYDVFICYKETDENGRRTQDSVIANDIYYQLKQEGFKVFYAAITLEGKLGSAYEPIIFAALNSAKVMLALGTKPEYFNAVWVKNEWSRFLKVIKKDRSKLLIPCYRDMDAYELPDEFAHLQAQDMSKIGFINDIVRGIKKVIEKDELKATVVKETVVTTSNANVAPILKRAFIFLEDSDWKSADEYCEKVLDNDPENAVAYLGKLMAELCVQKKEQLRDCISPFDTNNNYQKVLRYGNKDLQAEMLGIIEHINTRNKNKKLEGKYRDVVDAMNSAPSHSDAVARYKHVAERFAELGDYKDAQALSKECFEKAQALQYEGAVAEMNEASTAHEYELASKHFAQMGDYKDAQALSEECFEKAKSLKYDNLVFLMGESKRDYEFESYAKNFAEMGDYKDARALSQECIEKAKEARIAAAERETRNKKDSAYREAVRSMKEDTIIGLRSAIYTFNQISDWKDSQDLARTCEMRIEQINIENAREMAICQKREKRQKVVRRICIATVICLIIVACVFGVLHYPIYRELALNKKYIDAITLINSGNYVEAYETLIELDGYKDSAEKANSIYHKYKVGKIKSAKVGDYVLFGAYEQDNNTSNGKEEIEWLVLEVTDGKMFVISKYALDCKPFNTSVDATWENSTLRDWLNNDFMESAFSANEQTMIPMVAVSADKNPDYSRNPGNATQDQVFLLSINEVNKYFSSRIDRQCEATEYAVANGVYIITGGSCWWNLRTPGAFNSFVAGVYFNGDIDTSGHYKNSDCAAVRPAMWIDLNDVQ